MEITCSPVGGTNIQLIRHLDMQLFSALGPPHTLNIRFPSGVGDIVEPQTWNVGLFSLACLACHYTPSTRCQTLLESHCDYTSHERHRSAAYVTVARTVYGV